VAKKEVEGLERVEEVEKVIINTQEQ